MIFKTKSPLGKENIRLQETMRQFNKVNNHSALYKPSKHLSPFSHTFANAKYNKDHQYDKEPPNPSLNRHFSEQLNLQCDEQLQIFDKPKKHSNNQNEPQDNLTCDEMLETPKEQHQWLKKTYNRIYSILQDYHMRYLKQNQRANSLQQQNFRLREQMRYYRMK